MTNKSLGRKMTHRQNVISADASDPLVTLDVINERDYDADDVSNMVDKFIEVLPGCDEISVLVDIDGDSDTTKYATLLPIFLVDDYLVWGEEFDVGDGSATIQGVEPFYSYPVFIKVTYITAATTLTKIELVSAFS